MIEEDYKRVWAECLEVIKDTLGAENRKAFDTWFTPIVPLQLEGTTLIVVTHDPEVGEVAQRTVVLNYGKISKEIVNENFGKDTNN